jgi:TolB-like protein
VTDPDTTLDESRLPQAVIPIDAPLPAPHQSGSDSVTTNRLRSLSSMRPPKLALFTGLLILTGVGLLMWHRTRVGTGTAAGQRIHSLAVLPLENLSEDTGQEYFADGMTAELITELAKIGSLRVISRTSAMRYKRTLKPLQQIARELNVDAIVEGEVLHSRQRVRIAAQLVETATDRHLWAETYERDLRDAVDLQSEVAASIATAIKTKVTPEEHASVAITALIRKPTKRTSKVVFFGTRGPAPGLRKPSSIFSRRLPRMRDMHSPMLHWPTPMRFRVPMTSLP